MKSSSLPIFRPADINKNLTVALPLCSKNTKFTSDIIMIFLEFRNQLNIEHRKLSHRGSFTQSLHDPDSDQVLHAPL